MMRFLPVLYDWTMRRKITRLYGELMLLEQELETRGGEKVASKITLELEQLEHQANRLRVPVAYASMLYMLRDHIEAGRKIRAGRCYLRFSARPARRRASASAPPLLS